MAPEIERKYLNADFTALREKLTLLHAIHDGIHFESNIVFDTRDHQLSRKDFLLRLRRQCWKDRETILLTMKMPCAELGNDRGCKIREELELSVGDFEMMAAILLDLGYTEQIRYEKVRDCWRIPLPSIQSPGCGQEMNSPGMANIFLDFLPFGHVVEKECEKDSMNCLDDILGLDKLEISTKTYYELHQDWCRDKGIKQGRGFVFDPAEKKRILAGLGIHKTGIL